MFTLLDVGLQFTMLIIQNKTILFSIFCCFISKSHKEAALGSLD